MHPIPIVVDDREPPAMRDALCELPGLEVSRARLPVGDYRVDDRFLIERKTLADLLLSIQSGRLFAQALRLVEVQAAQSALVLEGTGGDLRDSRMRREAVLGALVNVSLFIGLPVLRTRTPGETARLIGYVARQGRIVAQGALPRRGRRPKGKVALQRHILQGLPGVGPRRAARLLERFGSVAAVCTAEEMALAEVEGVGRATARRIVWAVGEGRSLNSTVPDQSPLLAP